MNWYKRAQYKLAMSSVTEFTDDELQTIKELVAKGNSFSHIADLFGVTPKVIYRLNKKYLWRDVKGRPKTYLSLGDEKEIVDLRKNKKMSINDLASRFRVNKERVRSILDKYNARGRTRNSDNAIKDSPEFREKINKLYDLPPDGEGLPISVISDRLGYSKEQLLYYFRKIGKHIRTKEEYVQTDFFKNQVDNMRVTDKNMEQEIIRLYFQEQKTSAEIAKSLNISPMSVLRVINKYDAARSAKEVWDVPGARERMSEIQTRVWKEIGGLEGRLKSYGNREDALNYLHGFRSRIERIRGPQAGWALFNSYLSIVEDLPPKFEHRMASMNWYKRAQFGEHEKTIDGLSYMEIVKRIENAKARISRHEAQEAVFIRYLKTAPSSSVKNMWMNHLLSLQKSIKASEKTLNKYLQMIERTNELV